MCRLGSQGSGEDPIYDSGEPSPSLVAKVCPDYGLNGLAGPDDDQEFFQGELNGPGGESGGVEGGIWDDGEEKQGDGSPIFHPALGSGEEPAALFEELSSLIAYCIAGNLSECCGEAGDQAHKEGVEPGAGADNHEAASTGQENGGCTEECEDEYPSVAEGDEAFLIKQVVV